MLLCRLHQMLQYLYWQFMSTITQNFLNAFLRKLFLSSVHRFRDTVGIHHQKISVMKFNVSFFDT